MELRDSKSPPHGLIRPKQYVSRVVSRYKDQPKNKFRCHSCWAVRFYISAYGKYTIPSGIPSVQLAFAVWKGIISYIVGVSAVFVLVIAMDLVFNMVFWVQSVFYSPWKKSNWCLKPIWCVLSITAHWFNTFCGTWQQNYYTVCLSFTALGLLCFGLKPRFRRVVHQNVTCKCF